MHIRQVLPLFLVFLIMGCTSEWQIQNNLGTKYGIFVMDSDGTNVRQIHGSEIAMMGVNPSPDGTKLAFFEFSGNFSEIISSEVSLINIDGTGYKKLTNNDYMDFQPVWISNHEILFISNQNNVGTDVYVMDPNGNVLRQLTDTIGISEADPDVKCNKIVFTREHSIWIMDINGENQEKITEPPSKGVDVGVQFPLGDYDPNLSPDCKKVSFERLMSTGKSIDGTNLGDYDIYVYDLETDQEIDISQNGDADLLPKWSSDNKILFVHLSDDINNVYDVYSINSNGTERTKITGNDPTNFIEKGAIWFGDQIIFTAEFFQ